jgi:catechol 2,3-dioxygenase-like lactoylglutathione lyase family enzyme
MSLPELALTHCGIYVYDLEKQVAFYTEVLGFTETDRGEVMGRNGKPLKLVFLSRDPEEHHQIVLIDSRPPNTDYNDLINQLSLRADGLGTLRRIYDKLVKFGIKEFETITHGNSISIYARDPEGLRLEYYIHTPWYCTQPMRIPIDMSVDDATLWAQVEAHARSLPGFKPRSEWVAQMKRRMGLVD